MVHHRWAVASFVAVGLIGMTAEAANHTVELQLPAAELLNLVRAQAQADAPCPESIDVLGTTITRDHLEFPSASDDGDSKPRMILDDPAEDIAVTSDSNIVGHKTKMVLPMVMVLKDAACIDNVNGCTGARLDLDVYLDIRVDHSDGVRLCVVGDRLDPDIGIPGSEFFPERCIALPTDFGLDRLQLRLARAALSTNGDRLAVRLAFVHEDIEHTSVGEYESFLEGILGPGTNQSGPSLFIAENIFSTPFRNRVLDELDDGLLADFTTFSDWPHASFDKNTPSIKIEGTLTTNICQADLDFTATTVFSYSPDGQGGHWLKSDITDTEQFDFAAFDTCLWLGVGTLLDPFTGAALADALTWATAGQIAGNGVGSTVPQYPLDLLWNALTRRHGRGTNGEQCTGDGDCNGGMCLAGICSDPRCSDGVSNGDETSVDCGGPSCKQCDGSNIDEIFCAVGDDCESFSCIELNPSVGRVCAQATCSDGVWNGSESDVDCGEGMCQLCGVQQQCNDDNDCDVGLTCKGFCEVGDHCTPRVCVPGGCDNGIKDGEETLTDCGGTQCGECPEMYRINNHRILSYTAIDLPALDLGTVSATPVLEQLVTGQAGGLLLAGTFNVPTPPEPMLPSASIYPIVRSTGFSGTCYTGGFTDHGYQGGFQINGGAGARMCGNPKVVNNGGTAASPTFTLSTTTDVDLPVGYDITLNVDLNVPDPNQDLDGNGIPDMNEPGYVPPPLDPYWSNPIDPIVRVRTNGGAFSFVVPAPDVPTTSGEMLLAQMEAVGQKAVLCNVPGTHYWPGGYNPLWDIDPEYSLDISLQDFHGDVSHASAYVTNIRMVAEAYAVLDKQAYVTGAPFYMTADVKVTLPNGTFSTRLILGTRADILLERLETVQMSLGSPVTMVQSLGDSARSLGYPKAWATLHLTAADLSVP
jgi:hypothetical protein